jgi:hypothetical protein
MFFLRFADSGKRQELKLEKLSSTLSVAVIGRLDGELADFWKDGKAMEN